MLQSLSILKNAVTSDFDIKTVESIFRELEFRTLIPRFQAMVKAVRPPTPSHQLNLFDSSTPKTESQPTGNLKTMIVDSEKVLEDLTKKINASKLIALDTETNSTDPMRAELVGISVCIEPGTAYYIPVGHHILNNKQLPLETVVKALAQPFSNPNIQKAGHNIKYDALVLKRHGFLYFPYPLTP